MSDVTRLIDATVAGEPRREPGHQRPDAAKYYEDVFLHDWDNLAD